MKNPGNLPPLKVSDKTRIATKPDGTKIPVLDGKFTFLIEPNAEDIKNGVPGDPTQCMYCLAAKRMYGCDLVWVTRTRAYIELRGPKGRLELRRFVLKNPAQMQIENFDRGDVTPEAVIFAKPTGRASLNGIRARYQQDKLRADKPKRAFVKGKSPKKKHEMDSFHTLRASGTGMFQFPRPHIVDV
jgi:hypothetical protein